jgi:gamma-glutamylputrescine oxidase
MPDSALAGDYVDSYYRRTLNDFAARDPLDGEVAADVCVIGGGLAGLNTALGLAERDKSVVVLESRRVGWGASGRNGGFCSAGYSLSTSALADKLGPAPARELYGLSKDALALIRRRIDAFGIDCGPTQSGIVIAGWHGSSAGLSAYVEFMRETIGADYEHWPAEKVSDLYRTERYGDAAFDAGAIHINALNFTRGIARAAEAAGVRIHENSAMTALTGRAGGFTVHTARGQVRAGEVVCCMSGYIGGRPGRLKRATLPVATYVMLTEPLGDALAGAIRAPQALADTRFAGDYYRALPDGCILWGGRVSCLGRPPRRLGEAMCDDLLKVYPQLAGVRAAVAWDGLMGYARHKMPQIGRLAPGLWYCMGFGGKGVCATTMGGELIARGIVEGDETWRLFERFGLGYAGGPLGPLAAQAVYLWYGWRDKSRT